MALKHVCIWDPKTGYRHVTLEEARRMHPYGVSARGGPFVCQLCAANVLFTAPGAYVQHFRHDPNAPNKECDDRQESFDPTYGRHLRALNSYTIPLRITVKDASFTLDLGFFRPPNQKAHCDKIRIIQDNRQFHEYNFERIGLLGTTYLGVDAVPSKTYKIEYINANIELKTFWPSTVSGVPSSGAFFEKRTGRMLQAGGKAYYENTYYLLQRGLLSICPRDIEAVACARVKADPFTTWYLYQIRVRSFSESAAKFFLKYSIFLTGRPTKFYPVWPPYVQDPNFLYHNASEFYFYLNGDDAELRSYPAYANVIGSEDGRLYKLFTQEREQLVSIGKSGALGFSYLIKRPLHKKAPRPNITIIDQEGNVLGEEAYSKLPKSKYISVSSQYDGRAEVRKNGKLVYIYRLGAEQDTIIDGLSFGTEIRFYQGQDEVHQIVFEQAKAEFDVLTLDAELVKKLKACTGPTVPVTHAVGAIIHRFDGWPQTKHWLRQALKDGEMPRSAYRMLVTKNKR